jgi:hypothetical protein
MGYTVEQTTFIIISFPNLEIEEQSLMTHIRWIVNRQN